MKLKSVAGIVCFIKDVHKTAEFYEKLGFVSAKREHSLLRIRLNWFWIEFLVTNERPEPLGTGQFVYVNVEDVDEVYNELLAKGVKPLSEPRNYKTGRREVMIEDPDGYRLVFFQE